MLLARVTVECFWKMLLVGHVTEQCNTLFTHCYFAMFSLSIHQMQITCTHIFYHSIKMHTSPAQHPHFTRDLRNWRTFCARVARGFTTLACCRHEFRAGQDTGKKFSMYCSLARSTGISCQRVDFDTSKWPFTVSRDRSTFRARGLPGTRCFCYSLAKLMNLVQEGCLRHLKKYILQKKMLESIRTVLLPFKKVFTLHARTSICKVVGVLCNCIF